MRLLGRIDGGDFCALGNHATEGRAGIRHQVPAGGFDDRGVAVLIGDLLDGSRREYPKTGIGVDALAFEQLAGLPDLLERVVGTAEHDEIDMRVARSGIDMLVGEAALGLAIVQRGARLASAERGLENCVVRTAVLKSLSSADPLEFFLELGVSLGPVNAFGGCLLYPVLDDRFRPRLNLSNEHGTRLSNTYIGISQSL